MRRESLVCVADTLNNRIAVISHLMGQGMPCRTRRDAYDGGLVFGLIWGRRYSRVAAPHFIKEGRLGEINA